MNQKILAEYKDAKNQYAKLGVDTDNAIQELSNIPISIQCWQGDDIQGFMSADSLSGGIQVTGNYPGKARNISELRQDLEEVMRLVPGQKRVNLHAIYADCKKKKDIDQLEPEDFKTWVDWAKKEQIGLDFNPTCFSHPMYQNNFTLSSPDKNVRDFWIRHCRASLKIGDYFGKELHNRCVTNIWIPDGFKDNPIDRYTPRKRLMDSLDEILKDSYDKKNELVSVESKFFGIGAESYTTGSNEFYLGYAIKNQIGLTLDSGHFHPNEFISDKISSVLLYVPELLLHVSRPVNWDSDHVVILNDELDGIAQSLIRNDLIKRTHIGLDFFDATINRIAAWVIGIRSTQKALLKAYLEPTDELKKMEYGFDYTDRLALTEELKSYPFAAVYNYYCELNKVPVGIDWVAKTKDYEKQILSKRG
ncbi:MAG: L-rhamnose isomerase [Bacilli bacterium]|jgi:L-rhamnose isomerase